jgi:hypothetical protein
MFRKFAGVAVVVVLFSGIALAKEYKGRLKKVDTDAKKLTIVGKDKNDQTISYDDKTEFYGGPENKKFTTEQFDKFVKRFQGMKEKAKDKFKGKKDKGKGRRGGIETTIQTNEKDVATKVTFKFRGKGGKGGKDKPKGDKTEE